MKQIPCQVLCLVTCFSDLNEILPLPRNSHSYYLFLETRKLALEKLSELPKAIKASEARTRTPGVIETKTHDPPTTYAS